ncbi:MAG: hypothetical protein ABIK89_10470, partial [Planctomycetota bacterium]
MKKKQIRKAASSKSTPPTPRKRRVTMPHEPDRRRARELVVQLLAIPGRSGREDQVLKFIRQKLCGAGVPEEAIKTDQAHRRSPLGGDVGNLVCKLPGTHAGPRRLLMAHVDTVPLCEGATPVVRRGMVVPADRSTALGADDRAGAAVVLNTALEILRSQAPHPPLTF